MKPLDLTVSRPRPPREQLDGLMFLPRTIDKVRALLPGGKPGEYKLPGISEELFALCGIDEAAFTDAVARAESDADVVAWLRKRIDPTVRTQWDEVVLRRVIDDGNRERIAKRYPASTRNPQLVHLIDIIDADDREHFGERVAS